MSKQIRVLFVAGTGRTGSTLVGNLLGSIDGSVSVGELRHIWNRGYGENWSCGCGKPFGQCTFWADVTARAFGGTNDLNLDVLRSSERELLRLRNSWLWTHWVNSAEYLYSMHGHYLEMTERLYRTIADVSQAEVIVDSSKTPSYGGLLNVLPAIDLSVLHLVRDPRATTYSWMNPKASPDRGLEGTMDHLGARKSAFLWAWWNDLAEKLWPEDGEVPSARLQYEEFAREPESSIRRILGVVAPELTGKHLDIQGPMATISISHSVSGNPDRMSHGPIKIHHDQRWQADLARRDRAIVNLVAGSVMKHYGYERP